MSFQITRPQNQYVHYDFQKLWKYFPIKRSIKEDAKFILFKLFPFIFKNWVIYLNWKNAQVYKNNGAGFLSAKFWERRLHKNYPIRLTQADNKTISGNHYTSMAVVVHVFYPEIFDEILQYLSQPRRTSLALYITGPADIIKRYQHFQSDAFTGIKFLTVTNHGRDILPFLQILPMVFHDGHKLVLKLHTKGSNHLNRKEHWRKNLFQKLIGPGAIDRALEVFNQNRNIGMIGPTENILPMHNYYGSNAQIVRILSNRMNIENKKLADLNFVAGSMFYANKEVLMPILKLNLKKGNFEEEAGQKDGTLAHAIERLFAVGLIAANLQLADTDYKSQKPVLMVSKNHYYTS